MPCSAVLLVQPVVESALLCSLSVHALCITISFTISERDRSQSLCCGERLNLRPQHDVLPHELQNEIGLEMTTNAKVC